MSDLIDEKMLSDRQGTHADGCADWGPAHYECAIRERDELRRQLDEARAERDALRIELDVCRSAIEDCYDIVETFDCYNDSDDACQRVTLRRLNEAIGKAAPRLLYERSEGQKLYGLRYRELMAERDALANVLPGVYYMDPPDGGDVPVLEQLRRMAKDAERYRDWLRGGANIPPESTRWARWDVRYWNGRHWNTLFADQMDAAIDAARWKE